ncbi:MAG: nucleotidyltransferase domain-containing protein [Desulfobulbaceae bacterium]|nr:nucleotidyltransferase domain-containing protein [Desulfobulbaceae bacterium]
MSLLAEILSSKIRAEIFRLLFGTNSQALHMREIERKSGFAIGTIQGELRKLSNLDLVLKEKDGNRTYYRANKYHPLYSDIHNLVLKTTGMVDVLKNALDTKKIKLAFVFGSFARSEEAAASDVDLMVVGNLGLRDLTKLLSNAQEKILREINPHVHTEDEFRKKINENDHFISQIVADPKIFIIGSEDELKAMAG